MPSVHPSADLRIADLPPDLRAEGEALRAKYFALLGEGGFLNEEGAVDLRLLQDIERVKSCDLTTLRDIARTATQLENIESSVREYGELQEPFRQDCTLDEYRSMEFSAMAGQIRFSRFQWAQVRCVMRQSARQIQPRAFTPLGDKAFTVPGDIDLSGTAITAFPAHTFVNGRLLLETCVALKMLPAGLSVGQILRLTGCSALRGLPEDLNAFGNVDVRRCSDAVIADARRLKAAGKIVGDIITR